MKKSTLALILIVVAGIAAAPSDGGQYARFAGGDSHGRIYDLAVTLAEQAAGIAQESFGHFKGWNGAIGDQEQAILFKSKSFVASCRLFLKFAEGQSDFYRSDNLRTNLQRFRLPDVLVLRARAGDAPGQRDALRPGGLPQDPRRHGARIFRMAVGRQPRLS
jgi:hypothetical protein